MEKWALAGEKEAWNLITLFFLALKQYKHCTFKKERMGKNNDETEGMLL